MKDNALIIFTKIPKEGFTKTRMEEVLSKSECKALHISILKDLSDEIRYVDSDKFIYYTGDGDFSIIANIFEGCMFKKQSGDNIWDRMKNSIHDLFRIGYKKVILIGSDIPQLNSTFINSAYKHLDRNNIIISPTFDNGYCLIGMNRYYSNIFNMNKHCDKCHTVFDSTYYNCKSYTDKIFITERLLDLDYYEDLKELVSIDGLRSVNTLQFTKKMISKYK